jgi:hypothetical protein
MPGTPQVSMCVFIRMRGEVLKGYDVDPSKSLVMNEVTRWWRDSLRPSYYVCRTVCDLADKNACRYAGIRGSMCYLIGVWARRGGQLPLTLRFVRALQGASCTEGAPLPCNASVHPHNAPITGLLATVAHVYVCVCMSVCSMIIITVAAYYRC